ncbi:MAG: glutamate racemase [bacterium]|nr:glutamate racemase [bacterium]MBK8130565.1 glutamate racemase [bacterium]
MNARPIVVFDSGLGGLTVVAALHRLLPHEHFVFMADRARVPYASLSPALISRYACECASFLTTHQPKAAVIACNTVSAVALRDVESVLNVPVINVLHPTAAAAARATRSRRIGVLATSATVKRNTYSTVLNELLPGVNVFSQGCPLLVPLVEEGWTEGDIPRAIVEHYVESIRAANVDTVVLGCTHYEYFREHIQHAMGNGVTLVDTPAAAAGELEHWLDEHHDTAERGAGSVTIFSSDVTDALHRVVESLFPQESSISIHSVAVERLSKAALLPS